MTKTLSAAPSPRKLASDILTRVDEDGAFAEPLLDAILSRESRLSDADRRLVTMLVYGTLRMRGLLDHIIDHLYSGPAEGMQAGIRNLLRISLYQLCFSDKIPAYAAVNEAVRLARGLFPGRDKLVNALLRRFLRERNEIPYPSAQDDPAGHLAVLQSHPRWLVERWISLFGYEETLSLCRADNTAAPVALRANTLKMSRDELLNRLSEAAAPELSRWSPEGIVLQRSSMAPRDLPGFAAGWFYIQDEASQLVSRILNPLPGERVLDLCSGAGGKTTHLAALMKNDGLVVAADIQDRKLEDLIQTAERLGISVIRTRRVDATGAKRTAELGLFDRVLVDAPCTGTGTLRRNPELRWRLSARSLDEASLMQSRILENASACVRAGGFLLYCTCSVMPQENEQVIEGFLSSHGGFRMIDPSGIPVEMIGPRGFFRTFPHRHGTDGFFAALLKRV